MNYAGARPEGTIRDPSYYWVMHVGHWQPAEWCRNGYWMLIGYDGPIYESELDAVGEELARS